MRLLEDETYHQLLRQDKLNGTHKADSLVAGLIREEHEKNKPTSKEEAHGKANSENADPTQQIYDVTYELTYKKSGQAVQNDKQRISFYRDDLSIVNFFK